MEAGIVKQKTFYDSINFFCISDTFSLGRNQIPDAPFSKKASSLLKQDWREMMLGAQRR